MNEHVVAVDVGTGSARAGVVDRTGRLLARAERPIALHRPKPDFAQHDSDDIWRSVAAAVREAVGSAGVAPATVRGLGFDATCSLVTRDQHGAPLSVDPDGDARWDTIVWLDHRALDEASRCTASGHKVLDFIGGVMSPEMEIPKLLWLKTHLPERWASLGHAFDLADFLTWRATGALARSVCTLTCKWTYLAHEAPGWQADFLAEMGLDDLLARAALPERATPIGADLGPLTATAAADLGLTTACRVGTGLIDAHAGALGVLGGVAGHDAGRHVALIGGTSTCLMALSAEPRPTPGVWGPYRDAVLPGLWLNEGGQSATGALLDHVLRLHSAGGEPNAALHAKVNERIQAMQDAEGATFAARLHVLPDFHGNRSPLADPNAVGVVSGLTLDSSFDSLCRLYWRSAVAIALGVRHVLDALNARGFAVDTLHVTGGHVKNPRLMELYADATGCTVVEPETEDAVLLGTAIVAATAAGWGSSLAETAQAMTRPGRARRPDGTRRAAYDRDYRAFKLLHEQRRALDALASTTEASRKDAG